MVPHGAAKHHAQSRQHPDPAKQGSGGSKGNPLEQGSDEEVIIRVCHCALKRLRANRLQCNRCIEADVDCDLPELGPCLRCKGRKLRCSMMPLNPKTRRVDCHVLSKDQIQEFHIKQAKESHVKVKKGKQCAHDLPEASKSEGSGLAPSPLGSLAGLGALTLDSGRSSVANTPADSPPTLPQPPSLPECLALAPHSAPGAPGTSGPLAGKFFQALCHSSHSAFNRSCC